MSCLRFRYNDDKESMTDFAKRVSRINMENAMNDIYYDSVEIFYSASVLSQNKLLDTIKSVDKTLAAILEIKD